MKKISVLLSAVLLVGALSAFTTAKKASFQTAYGTEDGVNWTEVQVEDVGITYDCNSGSDFCLYDAINGNPLPGQTQDKQFTLR